ncbi:uncharacterized protein DUF3281 [Allofrancisella inopinata]|uniref:DUF3281 domain-containing protein n=1 Tax=Allofrancisella inopinata TaxID=1085647 RepID=A0AAE6YIG1_9GAMM|nr:DUF3281 family protein [Allofrancisella inopinata]QIV95349.1 DUF3281 domain-containing protein [Allofrancisella inopinata]TDT65059.1 uncharacterized protein DUF3281 [Allofrancisella inopinata]
MNKKLICVMVLLTSASLLSSCGTQEELSEYQIVTSCNDLTCSIALDQVDLLRYTTVLGKDIDQVLKAEPVGDTEGTQFDITWSISGGSYATGADMTAAGFTECESGNCTATDNPTGYVFGSAGAKQISVSGTITKEDGSTITINESKSVDVEEPVMVSSHTFTMPDEGQTENGVERPVGLTAQTIVNALNQNKAIANAEFSTTNNNEWTITCDAGYGWKPEQDPAWGEISYGIDRGVAFVDYNSSGSEIRKGSGDGDDVKNGYENGGEIQFTAGCWPVS